MSVTAHDIGRISRWSVRRQINVCFLITCSLAVLSHIARYPLIRSELVARLDEAPPAVETMAPHDVDALLTIGAVCGIGLATGVVLAILVVVRKLAYVMAAEDLDRVPEGGRLLFPVRWMAIPCAALVVAAVHDLFLTNNWWELLLWVSYALIQGALILAAPRPGRAGPVLGGAVLALLLVLF